MTIPVDPAKSEKSRADGNDAFKKGRWIPAIGHYTSAIVSNPQDPTAYTNRAAAYLKLDKYPDAERDCTTSLKLKSGNVKALYRRALARKGQDRLDDAEDDLREVLKLDNGNGLAAAELEEVEELIKKKREKAQERARRAYGGSPPRPSATIEEIHDDEPGEEILKTPEAGSPSETAESTPSAEKDTKGQSVSSAASTTATASKELPKQTEPPAETPRASSFADLRKSRDGKKAFVSTKNAESSMKPPPKSEPSSPPAPPAPPALPADTTSHSSSPMAREPATVAQASTEAPNAAPPPSTVSKGSSTPLASTSAQPKRAPPPPADPTSTSPGSGLHLLRQLTSLSTPDSWAYIQHYPSEVVPIILGPLLEPDTLGALLLTLRHGVENDKERVQAIMRGLKGTGRWKMNVAMLSKSERTAGDEAWRLSGGEGSWS